MTTPSDTSACAACGAGLDADQRYCLNCGAAAPAAADADVRPLLAEPPVAPAAAPALAAAGAPRLAVLPGREVSLGVAVGVFAFVLGIAAWAGAKTTSGPGPVPIEIAAAPAPAPAVANPDAATTETDVPAEAVTETTPLDVTDAPLEEVPVSDVPVTTSDTSTDTATDDTTTSGDDTTPAADEDTTAADEPSTPPLKHVWLISLTGQGYETLFDPEGQGPYLAKDLTKKGTLLSRYFGVTTGGLANGVALASGQAPNAATRADCPSVADLTPGTIGKDEQAAGSGCLYSTDVFSVADLLSARTRQWRAYAGALDATGPCPKPVAGSPFPAPRVPFLAFRTITEDATCADRITGLSRLTSDLAAAKTTPALSYIVPGPCEDGSTAPCSPGTAAGLAAADAFLRRTVPPILASAAYKDGGAIVMFGDQAPQGAPGADTSACCDTRPWQGKDIATAGGGRTGALVLSPFAKGGTVVDAPLDHYDLLKSVALGLELSPPGYAARKEVTGLPRETWDAWKPAASAARR